MSNNTQLAALARTAAYVAPAKIQSVTASVASSALTCTLNPTVLDFRSATLTSGAVNARIVPAAISLVVPSTATLGTINAVQSRLVLLAIDNAGTVELAIVNIAGGVNLDETGVISTTVLDTASDAANVAYSVAARTNVPFRVVGFIQSTQATAGTWATAPSTIQGSGGQAINGVSSIGYGQTWQNVTGSRSLSVTYYNTTGRPIMVHIQGANSSTSNVHLIVDGIQAASTFASVGGGQMIQGANTIVPAGSSYIASGTLSFWSELR